MSQALRLNDSSAVISDTLYFERRRHPRRRTRGQVTAVIRESGSEDAPAQLVTLDLLDLSDSGIGATADKPLPVGNRITVFFPPHGPEPGFDLAGEIVRCQSNDDRHLIGIALEEADAKQAG